MSFKEEIEKMKRIQGVLLEFVEDKLNSEENYENFINIITNHKMNKDPYEFKLVLRLINKIAENHQRVHDFINKIERILVFFKTDIKKHYSNSEIFNLFESNKRILLFIIQEKIILIDEFIVSQITNNKYVEKKYAEYFAPEIKGFITEEFINKYCKSNRYLADEELINKIRKEVPDDFFDKRKEGENDNYLCELIRLDKVKDFGSYIHRQNLSFGITIKESIFETNPFLIDKSNVKLNEYAAFFGSNEIIKYMKVNQGIEATPDMWYYAIHSKNGELIKELEDKHILPQENNYERILKESIKCHHNDVSKYIIDNLIYEQDSLNFIESSFKNKLCYYSFMYDNYCFFPENYENKNIVVCLFEFDYYALVKLYLEQENVDVNDRYVKISAFSNKI
ncbi:hypothetical protein M9Y10_026219 [Tritrichomonas musculus]|uniref:DUF3447 domain-containing protein n=1 Tax=Tritrichomonas musculus TaxID=1915356 RepID=A0ABR2H774_9EUKA